VILDFKPVAKKNVRPGKKKTGFGAGRIISEKEKNHLFPKGLGTGGKRGKKKAVHRRKSKSPIKKKKKEGGGMTNSSQGGRRGGGGGPCPGKGETERPQGEKGST